MKKLKISVSMLVIGTLLLFSASHAFADFNISPNGERDIPALFSYEDEK